MSIRYHDPRSLSPGPIRFPWDRHRVTLLVTSMALLAAVPLAAWSIGFTPFAVLDGLGDIRNLIGRMLPISWTNLPRLLVLLWETFLIAVAGTALAVVLSVPIAFCAARNTTPSRWLYGPARGIIAVTRAIPDLVFAIILVRALGLGALAGALALALNSIGMLGKLYADAIEDIDPAPVDAMRSSGAGQLQTISAAVFPQTLPTVVGMGLYRLDINVRTSPVLGLVGAGGIGMELQNTLRQLRYDRGLAIVVLIFLLIVLVERVSHAVRSSVIGGQDRREGRLAELVRSLEGRRVDRRGHRLVMPWTPTRAGQGVALVTLGALLVASFRQLDITLTDLVAAVPRTLAMVRSMFPPDFVTGIDASLSGLFESLMIAIVATFCGVLLSIPLALLGARTTAYNRLSAALARYGVVGVRGIPELILAIVFVAAVGLGPLAGALALSVGTIGLSAKLMMDALEEVPPAPLQAVASTGASHGQVVAGAVVPQVVPSFVGTVLYQLDVNLRGSVILGIVGAGGIGFLLQNSVRQLQYDRTAAMLIMIFLVVYGIERLSTWLRGRLAVAR